jgi:hypothetical protein
MRRSNLTETEVNLTGPIDEMIRIYSGSNPPISSEEEE